MALAAKARVRPCAAAYWSPSRTISRLPPFCWTRTPGGIGTLSLPFGPSTARWPVAWNFTPLGSGIGFFPTLDMVCLLPDLAEHFSANIFLLRGRSGHDAFGRGQNV